MAPQDGASVARNGDRVRGGGIRLDAATRQNIGTTERRNGRLAIADEILKFHRRGKILPHLQNLCREDFAKRGFEILSEACTARTLVDKFRPFGFYFHFKIYGTERCERSTGAALAKSALRHGRLA